MPWSPDPEDPVAKKRFERALAWGPKVHKAVLPLEKVRTRLAHATDRGNTYRVLARKES
jgi:hypothetical protein